MSIVAAIINFNGQCISDETVKQVSSKIFSFPGDRKAMYRNHNVLLIQSSVYNTPESINDRLPKFDESRKVAFCGHFRIDNRNELSSKLGIPIHDKVPDSRLILEVSRKYGWLGCQHLLGAFGYVIWSEEKDEALICRDHLGESPLFFYYHRKLLIVASSPVIILAHPDVDKSINKDFTLSYATHTQHRPWETFHKYINHVPPRTSLSINSERIRSNQYWDLNIDKSTYFKHDEEYVQKFEELFNASIKARIRSYRKVGSELSGGLDSGGVTAFAQRQLKVQKNELFTFSRTMHPDHIGKIFPFYDESELINKLCSYCHIKKNYRIDKTKDNSFLAGYDAGIASTGGLSNYAVGPDDPLRELATSLEVGTLLSGFPGDELVSSHCRGFFLEYLQRGQLKKYYSSASTSIGPLYAMLYLLLTPFNMASPVLTRKTISICMSLIKFGLSKEYVLSTSLFKESYIKSNNVLKNKLFKGRTPDTVFSFKAKQKNQILRGHTTYRMTMENQFGHFHKIESRYPLADIPLIEYVLSLPIEQKRNNSWNRWMYRRVLIDKIPEDILWRNDKTGAVQPFAHADFQNSFPERITWLSSLENKDLAAPFDIKKWINKAYDLNNRQRDEKHYAAGIQTKFVYLLRYLESQKENWENIS